jgi:hypothetical protein
LKYFETSGINLKYFETLKIYFIRLGLNSV